MIINEAFDKALADGTITQVYSGLDNACRCGCKGKYYRRGDKMFPGMLRKAIVASRNPDLPSIETGDGYVNIPLGNNRAYTIYFD